MFIVLAFYLTIRGQSEDLLRELLTMLSFYPPGVVFFNEATFPSSVYCK